jgi:metal-responsive CopG/Arc/MetJ family transcriptional regulator
MTRKVAISLPDELLAKVDRASRRSGISRSRFFGQAAETYLAAAHRRHEVEAYLESYRESPETDAELASTDVFLHRAFEDG